MTSQGGNNYSFGEKVGSGSYSTVFKAYQKQVSIKVCLDGFLFSQNHKHLVILDFFPSGQEYCCNKSDTEGTDVSISH